MVGAGKEDRPSSTEGVGQRRNRVSKFERGDRVKVRPDSASPYKGCTGTVETIVKQESSSLYTVQLAKSGDLALTDNFPERDLETIGG